MTSLGQASSDYKDALNGVKETLNLACINSFLQLIYVLKYMYFRIMFILGVFYKDYSAHFDQFCVTREENKKNGSNPFLGWTIAPHFDKYMRCNLDVTDLGWILGL